MSSSGRETTTAGTIADDKRGAPTSPPTSFARPGKSRPARHIGRVGALAVALGVFGAVAATPSVAWADDGRSKSGAASSASSNTRAKASTAGSPSRTRASSDTRSKRSGADTRDTRDTQDTEEDGFDDADGSDDPEVDDLAETDEQPSTDDDRPTSRTEDHAASEPVGEQQDAAPTTAPSAGRTISAQRSNDGEVAALHQPADDVTPAHQLTAANPLVNWGKQIGTTLNLPTPDQVTQQIRATVVTCMCGVINGVQRLFGGGLAPATAPGPASPLENTIVLTVLAWTRRQVDYAVAAFNRSPLGQAVQQVSRSVTDWFNDDVANSPFGREFSANLGAFLASCEDSTELPAEFDRTVIVSGLTEPTDFEFITDPDHPDRVHHILIAEKSGAIKSYNVQTGTLTTLIQVPVVTAAGERGLVGIEVDPNFWAVGAEGYHTVYAAYTGADNYDRLSSFTMSDSLTELGSEVVLLSSTELANEFHHGGELEFDPTGRYLYWAVGNNTTPSENSQDLTNIHGKILRLNRDGTAAAGNPFIDDPNEITQRIFAYGLRNPFRFGFDPDTGALLAGDVGEDKWEELNLIRAGGNYGWPGAEGACSGCGYIDPLYAYRHVPPTNSGSITSVLVYTDPSTPASERKVLISDYSLGWIRELTFDSEYSSLISERTFDSGAGAVVKLAQAPNGDIYQLNIYPGRLSVIAPSGGNRSPSAVIDASATSGAGSSLEVDFSAGGSSDPDGDALTYRWDFGNGQTSTAANPTAVFTNTADFTAYTVTLTVSDGEKQNVTTQRIVVGSTPPEADFDVTSAGGYRYNAGDTITFDATAFDDQDGPLPDSAYRWTVEFHHAEHKHPFRDNVVGPDLSFTVPTDYDQLSNTYYKVILNVTDRSGLTTTVVKDVRPNLVTLTFGANDPNARYTLDGIPRTGSHTEDVVVGVHRTLGAISPQTVGGRQLVFDSWSDGGAPTHVIVTPGTNTSYTVNYAAVPSSIAV